MKKSKASIIMFILLLAFWIILATQANWTTLIIGVLASGLVVFLNRDLLFKTNEATRLNVTSVRKGFIVFYVLLVNIFKSNLQVAKIVLSRKMPIDPGFETIRQPLKKELNQSLYANAITLTPGTLTVEMDDRHILVHGLIHHQVKDLEGSSMEKAFIGLEGDFL